MQVKRHLVWNCTWIDWFLWRKSSKIQLICCSNWKPEVCSLVFFYLFTKRRGCYKSDLLPYSKQTVSRLIQKIGRIPWSVLLGITKDFFWISLLNDDTLVHEDGPARDIAGEVHFVGCVNHGGPSLESCMIFKTSQLFLGSGQRIVPSKEWHQDP